MQRTQRNAIVLLGATLATAVFTAAGTGKDPPPAPVTLPGGPHNGVKTRWLAPYVVATHTVIDKHSFTSVRWMTADGKVKRELIGPKIGIQSGFVYDYGGGQSLICTINGDWQFQLPKRPGGSPYITSTTDGRVVVHQFHPAEGQIAVDLYAEGKLAGTVGPFRQYLGRSVRVADDGSIALMVWKDGEKKVPRAVAAGPDGKVGVEADFGGPTEVISPGPGGAGVLVAPNEGPPARDTWSYHTARGKVSSLHVGPNAGLVCWLPGTAKAVCSTAIGSTYRCHLVDWETGKRIWEIADPNGVRTGSAPQVVTDGGLLLFAGLERMELGGRSEPVRGLQAVEIRTGQEVSRWRPTPLRRFEDGGRFVRQGERLYLLTDDEFAEIRIGDIVGQKNGWR